MEKWTAKPWFYHAVAMKGLSKKYQGSHKKIVTIFQGLFKGCIRFSRTTYYSVGIYFHRLYKSAHSQSILIRL